MGYKGKHFKKEKRSIRPWVIAILLTVLLFGSVTGTLAYLQAQSHIGNTFTVAKLNMEINEEFNGEEKSNVTVKNTGDVSAYLRAAIVVNWKDADGNILPAETANYSMTMGSDWVQGADGYWYCKKAVEANQNSPALIETCKPTGVKANQRLCVDILVQGVQSVPVTAVEELWNATVSADGTLTPATEGGTEP